MTQLGPQVQLHRVLLCLHDSYAGHEGLLVHQHSPHHFLHSGRCWCPPSPRCPSPCAGPGAGPCCYCCPPPCCCGVWSSDALVLGVDSSCCAEIRCGVLLSPGCSLQLEVQSTPDR